MSARSSPPSRRRLPRPAARSTRITTARRFPFYFGSAGDGIRVGRRWRPTRSAPAAIPRGYFAIGDETVDPRPRRRVCRRRRREVHPAAGRARRRRGHRPDQAADREGAAAGRGAVAEESQSSLEGETMHIGAAMFFTDYSMSPGELGQALEERGFESVWAPEHSHIPLIAQVAVSRRRRAAEEILRRDGPVRGADGRGRRHQERSRSAPASAWSTSAIRSRPPSWWPRSTRCPAAASCSASATAGTRTRWKTTAPTSRRRHKLVRERIEAMKVIWTKSKAEYHGELVNFDPMMTWPKPVQKPHPPILVGGAFPYGARRARPLRRRLDAAARARRPTPRCASCCRSSARWRRRPTAIPPRVPITHLGREGGRERAEARPRRGRGARHRQPRIGQGRRDPARARPLGEAREDGGLAGARSSLPDREPPARS